MPSRRLPCGCPHAPPPEAYREAVAAALARSFGVSARRATQLLRRWRKLVERRRREGKDARSTAEHVARFERQHVVRPYGRDPSRRWRRWRVTFEEGGRVREMVVGAASRREAEETVLAARPRAIDPIAVEEPAGRTR